MFEAELEGSKNQMNNNFNITVDKKVFLKALSHVQSIVEKRNIIPILSNIKLVASNSTLELTATDMDIEVTEKISANIISQGSLTLPAQIIYDIVRKIPEGTNLNFKISSSNPGKVEFTAGKSNFLLPYLEANEFPSIEQGMMPFKFELTSAEIKSMIEKNKLFISSEETRYNLNGIYLHSSSADDQNILNAVATDGHRLSKVSMLSPEEAIKMPGIIIPRKAIIELNKIIDDVEGRVIINLSETKILFVIGEIEFISKLIDGNFPEYAALIPKDSNITMVINKKTFTDSIDRVSTISFEKTKAVKLKITGNNLVCTVTNEEKGNAEEETECQSNADGLEIGFNVRYLLDVMNSIQNSEVIFSFKDSYSPVSIQDTADKSAIYVVMPMRI